MLTIAYEKCVGYNRGGELCVFKSKTYQQFRCSNVKPIFSQWVALGPHTKFRAGKRQQENPAERRETFLKVSQYFIGPLGLQT